MYCMGVLSVYIQGTQVQSTLRVSFKESGPCLKQVHVFLLSIYIFHHVHPGMAVRKLLINGKFVNGN